MLTRTHLVLSVLVYFILLEFLAVQSKIVFLIFVMLGAMFVDVDSRKSKMGRGWWFRPLQCFVKHRGVFHSLFMGLLLGLVIGLVHLWSGIGFFVGYSVHLLGDMMTPAGVRIFYPIYNKKISFRLIRSGGLAEEILFVLVLLTDIFLGARFLVF
jgi:inner membrane protein